MFQPCFVDVAKDAAEDHQADGKVVVDGAVPENAEDDPDERSVFVKNVDFSADDAQLTEHFKECGEIVRVTIRKNPHTSQSLG